VRESALQALGRVDADLVWDSLLAELRNPDPQVRGAVALRLGEARAPESVETLVEALSDPEEQVRVNALAALSTMGHAVQRHQAAVAARSSDPSPRVRAAARSALETLSAAWAEAEEMAEVGAEGALSEARAKVVLDMATAGNPAPLVRALADRESARSLGGPLSEAHPDSIGRLLQVLRQTHQQEQPRAAEGLAEAVRAGGTSGLFLAQLKAIEAGVRLLAVEIAGHLGTPEATSALIGLLARDPVPEVRIRCASLLADAPGRDEQVRDALKRAKEGDRNEAVRQVATHALERAQSDHDEGIVAFPTHDTEAQQRS
jgi:HEAT repeat protein